jgi:cation diffusion facilitator family transporter
MNTREAKHEKQSAAISTVLTAVFITAMKLVVGISTGSLGILAEAADSGLDVVAAVLTLAAVRVSDKPADETHLYGHGKVENLAALVETLLLLFTCGWIIWEAISRLFFKSVEIEANVWAFGVVLISMLLDINRMRALQRAAKKHRSQALEASALRFRTDIWTSSVVLAGLTLVRIQSWTGAPAFLLKADAVAGLGVAVVVLVMGVQLGKRAVDVLLDTAPKGLAAKIEDQVEGIGGVTECHQVRIRRAGARSFVDLVLEIEGGTSFELAHEITYRVEQMVCRLIPGADVLVHYEPSERGTAYRIPAPGLAFRIRSLAHKMGADAHSIWARAVAGRYHIELHLEVDRNASLEEAHRLASQLEAQIKDIAPEVAEVVAHIEPMGDLVTPITPLDHGNHAQIEKKMVALVDAQVGDGACHNVVIWEEEGGLAASLHCSFSAEVSIQQAHDLSEQLEARLREEISELQRVVIHLEPGE